MKVKFNALLREFPPACWNLAAHSHIPAIMPVEHAEVIGLTLRTLRRPLVWAAFSVLLVSLVGLPQPAKARVWIGFGFPLFVGLPAYYPPAYYPPPVYYPPPTYYPPPPYYPPPRYQPSAQSCIASGAVCPMEHPVVSGSACYCTTAQGRVWGRAT